MTIVIFALLALIGWGIGDIFTTMASRKIGSFNASFYGYVVGAILSSLYIPFALNSIHLISLPMLLLTIGLSFCNLFAFLAYNEALKIGNSSLVGTIAGAFTALVVIFSVQFLGETLTTLQILSIIVVFAGLIFSTIDVSSLKKTKKFLNKGTLLALMAMGLWALYFTFIKLPVRESGFFWPSYIATLVGTISFLIFGFRKIKKQKFTLKSGLPAVFMSGLLLTIGGFSYNIAIDRGLSSIVAPIAGAYPALFALLAYLIFKDPITKQQRIGMVITLLGIILLAYFGR